MAGFPTRDSATCDGAGRRAWEDMRRGASVGRFPRERASARAQAPGTVPAGGSSRYRPRPPGPGVGGPAWRLERCLHEVSMFRMLLSLCSSRFLHEVSPLAPDGHAPQVRARGRVHETRLRTRVCLCVRLCVHAIHCASVCVAHAMASQSAYREDPAQHDAHKKARQRVA